MRHTCANMHPMCGLVVSMHQISLLTSKQEKPIAVRVGLSQRSNNRNRQTIERNIMQICFFKADGVEWLYVNAEQGFG